MVDLQLLVVAGPGLVADPELLRETVEAELPALGVTGRFTVADSTDALWTALAEAGRQEQTVLVALPGPDPLARRLMTRPGPHAARTVWYDLVRTDPEQVAGGAAHLSGRGVWGLVWAVRHAVHRVRHPARRIGYGPDPEQWAELRLPPDRAPAPVAVLIHGGYWRSVWAADLLDAAAIDLAGRGFAAWNLEYRRPDRHGWAATVADVAAGLAALAGADLGRLDLDQMDLGRLDLDWVAVLGHSAGAQLALQAAADAGPGRVALAVSLAGVLDLAEGYRRQLGTGAVAAALGGTPQELPEVYAAADPLARLPLRVPTLLVQGTGDDPDLVDTGRRYAAAARAAGDEVVHLEQPGDHFAVIDPAADLWHATADALATRLSR